MVLDKTIMAFSILLHFMQSFHSCTLHFHDEKNVLIESVSHHHINNTLKYDHITSLEAAENILIHSCLSVPKYFWDH